MIDGPVRSVEAEASEQKPRLMGSRILSALVIAFFGSIGVVSVVSGDQGFGGFVLSLICLYIVLGRLFDRAFPSVKTACPGTAPPSASRCSRAAEMAETAAAAAAMDDRLARRPRQLRADGAGDYAAAAPALILVAIR